MTVPGKFYNRAWAAVSSAPGLGNAALGGAAFPNFLSYSDAGVLDQDPLTILFQDGNNVELSECVYTAAGASLARNAVRFSINGGVKGTAKLSLSASSTASIVEAAEDSVSVATGSSAAVPAMNGTGAAGSSILYARGDHVHPSDTSRAPLASPTFTGTVTIPAGANISGYALSSSVPVGSSTVPIMDGSAVVGVATTWARADHVHPSDTTRAPLASPTFTGVPAGPTASANTGTTQLATCAFVLGQAATVAPIMDGTAAVGTATYFARQDHVHPSDTSRAPLASPTFTGVPAGPTATAGTVTTQLATCQFVGTAITNAAVPAPYASNPAMNGTASPGSQAAYARGDHVHPSDTTRVPLAGNNGSPMTGDLYLSTASWTSVHMNAPASGNAIQIIGTINNVNRWVLKLGDASAETGSNAGSNFQVVNYSDAGGVLYSALSIARPSANLTIAGYGYMPGGGPWLAASDARIKTVSDAYKRGLAQIEQLEPVNFTYKGNDTSVPLGDVNSLAPHEMSVPSPDSPHYRVAIEGTNFIGLVAQEVELVMPELVTLRNAFIDGQPVSDLRDINTGPLIFAMINAIKELSARLAALEAAR
jgi:hypothetical protein